MAAVEYLDMAASRPHLNHIYAKMKLNKKKEKFMVIFY